MTMAGESADRAFPDVGDVLAANLHRLRTSRRLSLATLATRADLAKATLANLEQGRGNPTIETLWSLAIALGVPFSDLLEDRRETSTVVVRAQQGPRVRGATPGGWDRAPRQPARQRRRRAGAGARGGDHGRPGHRAAHPGPR
jgi:transcriptional regulator with XRE-family HTH domain